MSFRFTILASGSTGNATLIESGDTKLIVDVGLSAKRIEQLMEERRASGKELQGVLVTHEHSDHIRGLGAFARKYHLPVYANEKTWQAMEKQVGTIDESKKRVIRTGEMLDFGALKVESFAISHDAAEPVGYCFFDGDQKLSLATDLGYISPNVMEKISDSDVLVLETNHDIEMLRVGHYPWNVKRRILGDTGHLSNDAAGDVLSDMITGKIRRVYLAHLSQNHNLTDLARMTVRQRLEERGYSLEERKLRLMDTYADRPTAWDRMTED